MKVTDIMNNEKAKNNQQQWRKRLSELGWKHYATQAPPSIVKKVRDYRNQLLKEWWEERSKETEN
jgi:hypothetical protein